MRHMRRNKRRYYSTFRPLHADTLSCGCLGLGWGVWRTGSQRPCLPALHTLSHYSLLSFLINFKFFFLFFFSLFFFYTETTRR
ncbi:hypothetical protein GDO81_022299 [Engystomops pustulosus]|uniref:Uncharacterized protein n=1 Tax=Engystomops pustulosus TaxID=76066 RepID=A0AAV6YNX0_ENGPU|nr:hypothetical protein GDO81_022299 [Engystomops pustulosus]